MIVTVHGFGILAYGKVLVGKRHQHHGHALHSVLSQWCTGSRTHLASHSLAPAVGLREQRLPLLIVFHQPVAQRISHDGLPCVGHVIGEMFVAHAGYLQL